MRLTVWCSLVAVLMFATESARGGTISFDINTASLQNQVGILAVDLIDSASSTSSAVLSSYSSDATIATAPSLAGGASGTFPGTVMLVDSSFFNEYAVGLTLGTVIHFSVSFTGAGPSGGELPDSFSAFLLDPSTFLPIFTTNDPTGSDALFLYDFTGVGDSGLAVYSSSVTTSDSQNAVPEPGTFWLLGSGLFVALIRAVSSRVSRVRHQLSTARSCALMLGLVALSSPLVGAVPVAGWTDLATSTSGHATGLVLNRFTNTYDSSLTISNTSRQALAYPIAIVVQGLPTGVSLADAFDTSSEGFPFILTGTGGTSVSPNGTFGVVLKFSNPANQKITFTYRVLAPPSAVANELQVAGQDANNNGVRDDIEPPIRARYAGSTTQLAAAFQLARGTRNILTNQGTTDQVYAAALALNKALACMYQTFGETGMGTELKVLRRLMIDTRPRVEAWLAAQNKLSGQSSPINFPNACEGVQ